MISTIRIEKTQDGRFVDFSSKLHPTGFSHEYVISTPPFNYCKWFLYSALLQIVSLAIGLHLQDWKLLVTLIAVVLGLLFMKTNTCVSKECLLAVSSLGIQHTTTFLSGRTVATFYDVSRIKGVVINEAVTMHRVVTYLCLLQSTQGSTIDSLVPLFQHTWPSLSCLEEIYRGIKRLKLS